MKRANTLTVMNSRNSGSAPLSAGDGLPVLTMADHRSHSNLKMKEVKCMTFMQYRAKMLLLSTQQAELLCELMDVEGIKKEPEQVRKNVGTILALLTETEAFLDSIIGNVCSSSPDSISD